MLSLTWNGQSQLLSIDWPFSSTPCLSLAFDTYPAAAHFGACCPLVLDLASNFDGQAFQMDVISARL